MRSQDVQAAPRLQPEELRTALAELKAVQAEVSRVYQGPASVSQMLLVSLLAGGHVLLEGVPGVAKTTMVNAFAEAVGASFKRIQFTPDLLPGDITGTFVLDMKENAFRLRRGPIFASVVLGDEINRAPAKTQSALLEAMQERQVTIEGETMALPAPFLVLATQNPVEQEGVYPLPEAQLDRFLLRISMSYPSPQQEAKMLASHGAGRPAIRPVLTIKRVLELIETTRKVGVTDTVQRYIVALAIATREHRAVLLGASPRASLALQAAARAHAILNGRDYANVDDVRRVARPVLAHRIILKPAVAVGGVTQEDIVAAALRDVPYDPA